jgi:gliding motility-associated-like protein
LGGDNIYKYQWQQSTDNISWNPASGVNTNSAYIPDTTYFSVVEKKYFRREVYSGPDSVCKSFALKSNGQPVELTRYHKIRENYIISNPVICVDATFSLNGSQPSGGAGPGSYIYSWEFSLNSGSTYSLTSPPVNTMNYSGSGPGYQTAAAVYRRVVTSSVCTNAGTLPLVNVLVQRKPVANPGTDAEACGGTVILSAVPTVGTGKWYFNPLTLGNPDRTKPVVTVKVDSSSFNREENKDLYFSWEETNGLCVNKDSVKITFYTRVKELGPNRDTTFYTFSDIIHLNADPLENPLWETGLWTTLSGSDNFDDHTKPDATIDDLFEGKNSYRWTVSNKNSSGTAICFDEYLYDINDIDIYIPNAFSPNSDGLYDKFIVKGLDPDNQEAELRIVNSAGTEVFFTTNKDGQEWTDWDGRNTKGSELPEGTYYYLLRLIDNDNSTEVYKKQGFVVLKRYGQVD